MTKDLDITKVRLTIAELSFDMEETIRLNPEFLLAEDSLKKEVIKAFIDQMMETHYFINVSVNDEFIDQNLLFLAIRLLELRKKIKEIKDNSQDNSMITE